MSALAAATDAVSLDTRVAGLRRAIQQRHDLRAELYKEAQTAVAENPHLKTVLDAYDMKFTDSFILKKKEQIALQALLQNLQDTLPSEVTLYDRQLILAELRKMRNSRL